MHPVIMRVAWRGSLLVALMVGLLALSSGALVTTALARAGVALFVSSVVAWGLILLAAPRGPATAAPTPAKQPETEQPSQEAKPTPAG